MQANKALLEKRSKCMLDFTLHGFRHRGDILLLVQKMGNNPVQVLALGAKNLHLREHFDQGLKTLKFHVHKDRKVSLNLAKKQFFLHLAP